MQKLARIVVRGCDEKDGLGLFCLLSAGKQYFKPGTVYEVREILGELQIVEVGPSPIPQMPKKNPHSFPVSWCTDISRILEEGKEYLWLTVAEWKEQCAKGLRK